MPALRALRARPALTTATQESWRHQDVPLAGLPCVSRDSLPAGLWRGPGAGDLYAYANSTTYVDPDGAAAEAAALAWGVALHEGLPAWSVYGLARSAALVSGVGTVAVLAWDYLRPREAQAPELRPAERSRAWVSEPVVTVEGVQAPGVQMVAVDPVVPLPPVTGVPPEAVPALPAGLDASVPGLTPPVVDTTVPPTRALELDPRAGLLMSQAPEPNPVPAPAAAHAPHSVVKSAGELFEESVQNTFRNKIMRQNEVLRDSTGKVLGEIDLETAEAIVEVGTSLRGKVGQLHKLAQVAQDRAKRLDVIYGPDTSAGILRFLQESLRKKWGNRVRFIPHE